MGMLCPQCKSHQPYKRYITHDGKPAVKQDDIVSIELGCGHMIGGEQYNEYKKTVAAIKSDHATKVKAVFKETNEKIAAASDAILKK